MSGLFWTGDEEGFGRRWVTFCAYSSAMCCAAAPWTCRRGAPGRAFTVTLTCCDDPALTATATGFTVEAAKTRAVEASDLVEHVGAWFLTL